MSARTWITYRETADLLVAHFGKARLVSDLDTNDFAVFRNKMTRKKWGAIRIRNLIQRVRSVFKFGFERGLFDLPVRFGPGFAPPNRKTLRVERAKKGPRMFEAPETRAMIEGVMVPGGDEGPELVRPTTSLKVMILLGVNCGFGNSDCGTLPLSALDLERGW